MTQEVITMDGDWSVEVGQDAAFIRYRNIDVVGFWAPIDGGDSFLEVAEPSQFWEWASDARNGVDWSEPYTQWAISNIAPSLTDQTAAIDDALAEIEKARRKDETLQALKAMADDFGAVEEFLAAHGYTKEEA